MSTQLATILQHGEPFLVGEWLVEPSMNRLSRAGVSTQLELKAMDVLLCLVERAGEVVPKHDLLDRVWQTEFVSDNTIAARIAELRSAFGDDAQVPRYIETIRKRGYRLIAEVRPSSSPTEESLAVPESPPLSEEETNPYPGLAVFTEADADRFFGREAEISGLWRKISARRLLAVIGPSGVGKSSLLRAGVAARAPPGWRVVVITPGEAPSLSLARALAPDHAGDPAAMARLLGFNDSDTALAVVSRWRGQFEEAVIVVDQFEELFTLNPPEVQASFIELLRRLVDAADVHLVLAMRDDYLYRCQQYREFAPVFDALTPLATPTPEGLRRALKEPAARQLYRFDSELLVDRMIAEVEGERGALPLMAFAVHRLWEERDREERLLTEEAFERIGGVGGALAKHADATLERIGSERLPIVRELFRNLVTAEGTRAVREVDEVLSVFDTKPTLLSSRARRPQAAESRDPLRQGSSLGHPATSTDGGDPSTRPWDGLAQDDRRGAAEEVLQELIDARLLTGYRVQGDDEQPTRRVEIIHESLLTSWPRLVRWQTQDADSARLRDELRQAARMWDDHERANDYLWTGKAFKTFDLWREDYPGGLTDLEEDFAAASVALARRRSRRRRVAGAAALAVAAVVAVVFGILWRQGILENRRAEAQKLVALGQLRLEDYPTATLAHAIASIELADTAEARRLGLEALWEGPSAFVVNTDPSRAAEFTPDGDRLVQSIQTFKRKHLGIVAKDGSRTDFDQIFEFDMVLAFLNPEGTVLFSKPELRTGAPEHVVLWSLPEGRKLCDVHVNQPSVLNLRVTGWNRDRFLALVGDGELESVHAFNFDGSYELLTTMAGKAQAAGGYFRRAMDLRTGHWFASADDGVISIQEIGAHELSARRMLGRHSGTGHRMAFDPKGRFLGTSSSDGQITIWDPTGTSPPLAIEGPRDIDRIGLFGDEPRLAVRAEEDGAFRIRVYSFVSGDPRLLRTIDVGKAGDAGFRQIWGWDPSGHRYARSGPGKTTRVWSLSAPADAAPVTLNRGDVGLDWWHSFHPNGEWLATADLSGLMVWPLGRPYPSVIRAHQKPVWSVAFGPGGRWLASGCFDGLVRLTPLDGEVPASGRILGRRTSPIRSIATSPDGTDILVGEEVYGATVISLEGGASYRAGDVVSVYGVGYSPDGRLAALVGMGDGGTPNLQILNSDGSEERRIVYNDERAVYASPRFLSDGRVVFSRQSGLWILDPATGSSEQLFEGKCHQFAVSEDGSRMVVVDQTEFGFVAPARVLLLDLDAGTQTHLASHGDKVWSVAMDAAGTIVVTGDREGVLRVGSTSGEEPHLLLGHEGRIWSIDIDPLGRWIATGGEDTTVRIWPMPDLSQPPLNTLPHDELLAKLKSLTNLRVVRDDEAPTGWTLTHDPFPGWETVPSW